MLIVVIDILLRIVFSAPIIGGYEIVQLLMILLIYFGLPYVTSKNAHISVGIGISRLPIKSRLFITGTANIYGLLLFVLISVKNFQRAVEIWQLKGTTSLLYVPLYPFYLVVSLGCVLVCAVLILQIINHLNQMIKQNIHLIWILCTFTCALAAMFFLMFTQQILHQWEPQPIQIGAIAIVLLFLLIAARMPIGIAMGLVGFLGYCSVVGYEAGLSQLELVPFRVGSEYLLSVVPLFILMGQLALHAGLSQDLYDTSYAWLGQLPGGLAMATVGGCAAFAAVSGSSLATAVTVGSVALPGMRKYKYDDKLALGSIAAGGTIGILIPPSLVFILYGIMTEQSIGSLFLAGIFPGLMTVVLYFLTIMVLVWIFPKLGPRGPKTSLKMKIRSLGKTWGMLILFGLVLGGIYLGFFTPTEAGAVGAFGALLIGLLKRRITWQNLLQSLEDTVRTTGMLFMVFIGAMIFNYFLAVTNLPASMAQAIMSGNLHTNGILSIILFMYLLLGCFMDPGSMIILTIPIIFPIIQSLGFDPIWFGVLIVIVAEIGCITPPVGINVFAVKGIAGDVPIGDIYKGIIPFWITDIIRLLIIILLPQIALFLPNLVR
jgi:tripartite ATP-independent transporter DctM subunit